MARKNVVDGLAETLKTCNGFDAVSTGTVSVYSHYALTKGVDRAAIIVNNRFEQVPLTIGGRWEVSYDIDVELYIRHNNNIEQARVDADTYVGNIIAHVNNNRTLGGSAFEAIVAEGRVEDERFTIGGPPYLLEVLTVRAQEIIGG